jgi:tRNA modification GTPase
MLASDTIVARASAPGSGRRAIVRLAGPQTAHALRALGIVDPGVRSCTAVRLSWHAAIGPSQHIEAVELPALLMRAIAPASYTGDDAAEIILPNNATLIAAIVRTLLALDGIRAAEPGEFTARAFMRGRMTLAQAEGIAAKVAAETHQHIAAAQRLLEGRTGDDFRRWIDQIANLLALVESGIDFADEEDVVPIRAGDLHQRLECIIKEIATLAGTAATGSWNAHEPLVVIVGAPNAGKSSLFNALLGRTRVIESPVAGATRDVIVERCVLEGGLIIQLADLPGLDADAPDALARDAQSLARRAIARADLLLACDPHGAFDWMEPTWPPHLRVHTKVDSHVALSSDALSLCCLDGWHVDHLTRAIAARAHAQPRDADALLIPRHQTLAHRALTRLREAQSLLPDQPPDGLREAEMLAASLRLGLDDLGELAGRISPDEVIGRIFAQFCIGK